jgi:two-component system sensor kinase FixL
VPLTPTLQQSRFLALAQRTRGSAPLAYGIALIAVASAALLRLLFLPYLVEGVPFITFYPAIIIATIFGGLWPGVFATVLSGLVAWFAFIPPEHSLSLTEPEFFSLLLFFAISGINIALVTMLNKAVERLVSQERNIRTLVEAAPNGIVVVDEQGVIRAVNKSAEALFGYDRSEMVGQKIEMLVPQGKRVEHLGYRRQFIKIQRRGPWALGGTSPRAARMGLKFPWK